VHLAGFLQSKAPALLIDGDPNRSATGWAKRGQLPFRVIDERQAARFAREYQHVVIDTEARPQEEDLRALADGCDLLVIPSCPDALSLDALMQTTDALSRIGGRFKILLTIIPPKPSRDGEEARATLKDCKLPLFAASIRRL
jgi:chromosome partitioning protein